MTQVAVIGGGISGLACARIISDRLPGVRVTVLESSDRVGGNIHTSHAGGFVCEAGPSGFLNRDPSTLKLVDRVGLSSEIICGDERVRRRYILSRGRLRQCPDSVGSFLTSDLLSLSGRLRMMLEFAVPRRPAQDETVAQFATRRLGREAAELLVDPVISGIYAGDATRLSLRATLPHLAAVEARRHSILRAMLEARRLKLQEPPPSPMVVGRRRYVSFKRGMGQLVDGLSDSLRGQITHHSPVDRVRRTPAGRWRVLIGGVSPSQLDADVVVSAAPAPAAARYLRGLAPEIDDVFQCVPYGPVAVVALGFREADIPHPLHGFGYLVPRAEDSSVLGVLWASSIFGAQRSRPGTVLLQAIVGGTRAPDAYRQSTQDLVNTARVQLKQCLGVEAPPIHATVTRHPLGMPQYEVGHLERVAGADAALERHPGLFMTGNALRGIGINYCTADAYRVGDAVARYLRGGALTTINRSRLGSRSHNAAETTAATVQ